MQIEPAYSESLNNQSEANSTYYKTLKVRSETMSAYYDYL